MSFSAISGLVLKLQMPFLKIRRWVLLNMARNCKLSGPDGKFSSYSNVKKTKEPFRSSNGVWKWRILLVLCALGCVAGSLWLLSGFNDLFRAEAKASYFCEEKARILQEQFNVSKHQLKALASIFSKTDQVAPVECAKELESNMQLSKGLACALKLLCAGRREFEQKYGWEAEALEVKDQCPVQEVYIPKKLDLCYIRDEPRSFALSRDTVSSIFSNIQIIGQNMQRRAFSKCTKETCESIPLCSLKIWWWVLVGLVMCYIMSTFHVTCWGSLKKKQAQHQLLAQQQQQLQHKAQQQFQGTKRGGEWRRKLLFLFVFVGVTLSIWLFWHLDKDIVLRRKETLANMCDERARMLQDQFNVSMNHVHALAILVSTFHHGKQPSAIDQKTFGEYTERTDFERPLTSGVAYALKVLHSEREQFEQQHGWTIKKMETEDQSSVQDYIPEKLDPSPPQDEYAPVILSQETVSHIVSIDMMSGKEDHENILRARASGKGVLTSPFKLLKSNHLGVVLTFAVYNTDLPQDATPEQRIEATVGYLGASYDVPSLVEKLLQQLASEQTIVVNVYDITNISAPINMYGPNVSDTGLLRISNLDFGDPFRKHEMHCRFKHKPSPPWTAITASVGVLVITLLLGHIFHAAISRIDKVEDDFRKMMELKVRAEAADVAKSQFLATVSHEIRTPMNGVLGMLRMLMDSDLDEEQRDYAQTAHASGNDLISLINEVLDQAKIESGRLELEAVPFDVRATLDSVLSLFSGKSRAKGIELAAYTSDQVPEVVIGDPGRFRQIITNLVGNSIKFTGDKGHILITVHLADEVRNPHGVTDRVLKKSLELVRKSIDASYDTLSGFPVVNRWKSWENFKFLNSMNSTTGAEMIRLLVTVEDTGVGIPRDAQSHIFMPFMQADSSTSRTYGGTGIGLSISKRLVDLMDGEMGFVSEPGIGSTFSFTAVFKKGQTSSLDIKWYQYEPMVSEFHGLRALVVDGKSVRAEVIRYHLQRVGLSVDIAYSLKSACSYLSNPCNSSEPKHYAVVVVDEDASGKEKDLALPLLLEELKQNTGVKSPENCPKIFLLAMFTSTDEHNEFKSAGCVDNVIMKPLRSSMMSACFQKALGVRKKRNVDRGKPSNLRTLLRGKQVLVVDDNLVNRRVAEGALRKYGAIVTCVDSGKAAIGIMKPPHKFDACFMDLQMPEMDGFEATRQIRCNENKVNEQIESGEASIEMFGNVAYWHTPILAMTADVIQATNEECMKCGMDDYVSKPFGEEQLYSAVTRFFVSDL